MKNIIVLGAGMVGSAMAVDMAKKHRVTLTDIDPLVLKNLKKKHNELKVIQLDVTDKNDLQKNISDYDLVISAVPGFLGYETLKSIIEAEKDVVDISFFPENSLELDELARQKNVTSIVDCGVAPGMHNIILGHYNEKLKVTDFECLVGGLPKQRKWPFAYKAPFSPVDVIEEYTRPARYVENGKEVVREALSDVELVDFEEAGTLESFNSDGLRTLIYTMPHIRNMKEKTLRYPGHVEYINVLKKSGFFDTKPMDINGKEISPLEFTSKVLFKEWKLGEEEEELTVMRVTVKGEDNEGKRVEIIYSLHDEYCPDTKTSSMARTTGYTATAAANMMLDGLFNEKGVFPPELISKDDKIFKYIIEYLAERNVFYSKEMKVL